MPNMNLSPFLQNICLGSLISTILLPDIQIWTFNIIFTSLSSLKIPINCNLVRCHQGFLRGSDGEASIYNAGDLGLICGLRRSPGKISLQYSCLENSMEKGNLMAYSPQGPKVLDMTEQLTFSFFQMPSSLHLLFLPLLLYLLLAHAFIACTKTLMMPFLWTFNV